MTDIKPGIYRPGEPGFIAPGTPEHSALISPSKVAAIMGLSRWDSPYCLWHRMKGLAAPEPEKDIFRVGHAFELALAELWRYDNPGWQLSPGEVQYVGDPEKFGFPYLVTLDRRGRRGRTRRDVEFKIARSLEDWGDDFTDEAPPDYFTQVLTQQVFSGLTKEPAHLVVMGPRFQHHTYVIPYNMAAAAAIIKACKEFWDSLDAIEPPPLDNSVATYEFVREQHPDIARGITVDITPEDGTEFLTAVTESKEATNRERGAKTRILDLMGDAQYATAGGVRIARRQPGRGGSVSLYAVQ
ncbi:putative phage-type endonuclease [Mycobacteroides abscessus subsp. massiliense]|uniref:hypothetical protein n=1 Tax=Mycobacteroides abscessus TaxID=36809 RepID=UPI0009A85C10|nr:hypothetical protein [Mycobacteroides abscessus]SLC06173.1 putative phage-type endonuclease [Mycobacteroides abscessus subsp. massiliense]